MNLRSATAPDALRPGDPCCTGLPRQPRQGAVAGISLADTLRQVSDIQSDTVALIADDGCVLELIASSGRFLNYTSGYLSGKKLMDFVHPRDKRTHFRALNSAFGGAEQPCRVRCIERFGSTRHIWLRCRSLTAADGTRLCVAVMRDVSERIGELHYVHQAAPVLESLERVLHEVLRSIVTDPE